MSTLNAVEIAADVRSGRVSAEATIRAALERIEAANPQLFMLLSVPQEYALQRAREIDRRRVAGEAMGLLAGVPVVVKDNLCTHFGTTTCGSRILEKFESPYDAQVVERLHAADAVIVGKANLDEFAMGSSTENSAFGVTRNPWDISRVAGGSCVAVACGAVPLALGSDTGGSIRLPASFCGVVGLKPSYGRVSRRGLVAFGSSLDQIGPIARTAAGAALLLGVIAGHDQGDSTSVPDAVPNYLAALGPPRAGLRIGIAEEYFGDGLNPEVKNAVQAAIQALAQNGATVSTVHLPHMKYGIACYYLIATAEASSNLARFDGVRYGHRSEQASDIHEMYALSRGEGFGAEVKRRIMLGTFALSSGYHDAYYLKAQKVRTLIQRDFASAFERVDIIASPVAPTTAFPIGEKSADPLAMYLSDIYTIAANLAGLSAISVPCGFDKAGMPIGLQLMAPALGEPNLLAVTHAYQCQTNWHLRTPG